MAFIYYKFAEIDSHHPRALAVCDRCGAVWNHFRLHWQYDWMGAKVANLRLLVCRSCMDELQEQRRQIILPRDPIPIEQPRLEPTIVEVGTLGYAFDPFAFDNNAFQHYTESFNTAALNTVSAPTEPDSVDKTALVAVATKTSSYFSINQDLGVN